MAAALLEMVSGFAEANDAAARAAALREQLLEAGEQELRSYEPVLQATTPTARRQALSEASETPTAIARAAAEVAELAARVASQSKPALKGDAVAAVLLAEAVTRAAARLVEINLKGQPEDLRLSEVARLSERAASARDVVLRA
jgi:formiminotetrahydrofolate cyclodeaminase